MSVTNGSQIGVDTGKVVSIAQQIIEINNRQVGDFSAVEEALKRLGAEWSEPSDVATAAFKCFDQIKTKYFDPTVAERRELAQFLCDAVGIGYENTENQNKKVLEGLFDADTQANVVTGLNNHTSTVGKSDTNTNTTVTAISDVYSVNSSEIAQYNSSYKKDENYISSGCHITSVSNLYRRKQAVENIPESEWINKTQVYEMNNYSAYYSSSTASKLYAKTGYEMQLIETKGGLSIGYLSELLKDRPEGICVFANGDNTTHAILITGIENGQIMVVDPSDGGNPRLFSDTASVKYKNESVSIFYGWSQEKLLSNITSVKYIK